MKKQLVMACGVLGALLLTACNNDNVVEHAKKVTDERFIFNVEPYQQESHGTRAAQTNVKDTVDLGDGFVAEVALQADNADDVQTRATAIPDEHYTIYALNSSGQRIAMVKGNLSGGKFTLDAGSPRISIAPGTYTFVCFNDAVQQNAAGGFSVPTLSQNPMMGIATETISGGDWQVTFNMKHQAAHVRLKMTSYTAEGAAIKATLGWTTPQPATDAYHLDTTADAANNTTGTNTSQDYAFAVTNSGYDSIVKPFYQVTDYQYLLPGTQTNALSVHLTGGTLHGKTLSGKEIPLTKNTASLLRNGSYTLNVTLKSKDPLYLYQDGTVGYLGDQSSTRKPIAVVVQDKTASTKGLAVALKDDGRKYAVGDLSAQYYFYFIGNDNGTFNNMQGYDITYTTNYYNTGNLSYQGYSIPTVPPAEAMDPYGTPQRPLLHTYYYAAHHNPGVTVSGANVGKWFLPSSGHWRLAMIRLGNLDATKLPDDANDFYFMINNPQDWAPWDGAAAAACFTKAGGTLPLKEPYALSGTFQGVPAYIGLGDTGVFWANDSFVTNSSGYARAFVYF